MGKDKKKKRVANRFVIGRHGGCEALLYEFRERSPCIAEVGKAESADLHKPDTTRIAANTLDEALEYLRWDRPHFVIDSVQNLGLMFWSRVRPWTS
jgi:hypothetical protein